MEGSGNDFMCVVLHQDILYAVWGDVRTSKVNIWLNKIDIQTWTSSISEVYSKNTLQLYPNPTHDFFTILTDTLEISYIIYDQRGKIISKSKTSDKNIDLSYLPSGTYILEVEIVNKLYHQKIVKQ